MRPLEVLVILGAAAFPLRLALLPNANWPGWAPLLPLALLALLAAHLVLEGGRPQMAAAYAVVAAVAVATLLPVGFPDGWPGILIGVTGLGLLATATAFCVFHPVFQTPAPIGPHTVGTLSIRLDDGPAMRIWYPADPSAIRSAGWAPYALDTREAARSSQKLAQSRSLLEAPVAASPQRHPVLVFLPGWGGNPVQNTTLLQDVASSGYVVAAPDAWDRAGYPGDSTAAADLSTPLDYSSEAALAPALAAGKRNARRQAALASRALDALASLDSAAAGRFSGRLDLDRAGIFGFSFGGGVAAEVARTDPRFKAAVSEDGWVFTDAYEAGFTQPYLLLASPLPPAEDLQSTNSTLKCDAEISHAEDRRVRRHMARYGGTRVTLQGVLHGNFTDAPLASPLRRRTEAGRIDQLRARLMISGLTIAFFDRHLRDIQSPVLAGTASTFPEAMVQTWPSRSPDQAAPTRHADTEPAGLPRQGGDGQRMSLPDRPACKPV